MAAELHMLTRSQTELVGEMAEVGRGGGVARG